MRLRTLVMFGAVAFGAYQAYKEMQETRANARLAGPSTAGGI